MTRVLVVAFLAAAAVGVASWVLAGRSRGRADTARGAPAAPPAARSIAGDARDDAPPPPEAAPWRLEVHLLGGRGTVLVTDADGEALHRAEGERFGFDVRGTVHVAARPDAAGRTVRAKGGLAPPASGVRVVALAFEDGLPIAGRLVDETGRPVRPGIGVGVRAVPVGLGTWFTRAHMELELWDRLVATPDAHGRFRIGHLAPGADELDVSAGASTRFLPPEEAPRVDAGAEDVVVVCRRAVELRVHLRDAATGEPVDDSVIWRVVTEDGGLVSGGGSSGVGRRGYLVAVPCGRRILVHAEADGYRAREPLELDTLRDPGPQEAVVLFTPDPGFYARLDLSVRDETGAPVPEIFFTQEWLGESMDSADGRYAVRLAARRHELMVETPDFRVRALEPGWLPVRFVQELERGGHATREIVMPRAGTLWIRGDGFRVLRGTDEVDEPRVRLDEGRGHAILVAPGRYIVESAAGDARVEVDAAPHAVTEVDLPE